MTKSESNKSNDIAIIGMSCRFPGANNLEEFWNIVSKGESQFSSIPKERSDQFDFSILKNQKGSFLENPFHFDNEYFNISNNEAIAMDPQQRIMLELTVEARENALMDEFDNKDIGVYIGANQRAYMEGVNAGFYRKMVIDKIMSTSTFEGLAPETKESLLTDLEHIRKMPEIDNSAITGNISNMISSRISHEFNLIGPSLTIDTACSSSLVATHLACEALLKNDCDLALSGGVNYNLTPSIYRLMEEAHVISPSGNCTPFSADSDGILLGEGAGVILLKRMEDAIRDGDPIFGVIKGTGVNNDGRTLSVMAPSWKGQMRLLDSVYSKAMYDKKNISLIEAHGTSTRIGDSVEITVLDKFFNHTDKNISIGSVKSNIGHLLGASGIAGLIKAVLALHNKELPPSLHGEKVNSKWKLQEKGFKIQDKLEDWSTDNIRAAGVSSFGFGGTNAHIIIEELGLDIPRSKRKATRTSFKRKKIAFDLFPGVKKNENAFFKVDWLKGKPHSKNPDETPDNWIMFGNSGNSTLKNELLSRFPKTRWVEAGNAFIRSDENTYVLDYFNEDHIRWFFEGLSENKNYGLLYFQHENVNEEGAKTIRELNVIRNLFIESNSIVNTFWCVTQNAFKVIEGDKLSPHSAAIATLFSGALEEKMNALGGLIDYSDASEFNVNWICDSLDKYFSQPLVIRDNELYLKNLVSINSGDKSNSTMRILSDGVYLVLGGSSGIGAEMVYHLHKNYGSKIVFTGTREEEELPDKIKMLLHENSVEYLKSSVLYEEELARVISSTLKKFGHVNGIIYAAGTISYGTLTSINEKDFQRILQTKIQGLSNLKKVVENLEVDFIYLMSSISGLSPSWSKGMVAYGTANAYLDAIAMKFNSEKTVWFSRSWSMWKELGMSHNVNFSGDNALTPFQTQRGLKLFESSLEYTDAHLAILDDSDAKNYSNQLSYRLDSTKKKNIEEKPLVHHAPIQLNFREILTSLIAEAIDLPTEEIDQNESFTSLGLDSISALDIVGILEKEYQLSLNPTLLFEYDNVNLLSDYLNSKSDQEVNISYELLPTQKTFYSNQVFYPETPCNTQVSLDFDFHFDLERLNEAWDIITRGHESLRLAFSMTDKGPVQLINESASYTIEHKVIKDSNNLLSQVDLIQEQLVKKVYELSSKILYDVCYLEKPNNQSSIIFCAHHIITDAWSMSIILKELLHLYTSLQSRVAITDATIPKFSDYIHHINKKDDSRETLGSRDYWMKELKDFTPIIIDPKINDTHNIEKSNGIYLDSLDKQQTKALENFAIQKKVSVFHALVSAYCILLYKITEQPDIAIRLASENRDRTFDNVDKLSGCIADSIPLRIKLDHDCQIEAIAARVKDKIRLASLNSGSSSLDFASILQTRNQCGPVGITPFGMSYVNADHFWRVKSEQTPEVNCRVSLPFTLLSFMVLKQNGTLKFSWNYSKQHYTNEEVKVLNKRLIEIIENDDLVVFNSSNEPYENSLELPREVFFKEHPLLHEKVFAACGKYGAKTAIVENNKSYSYSNLNEGSIQVANALIKKIDNNEQAIGVLGHPNANTIMGIIGTLASGLSYIPIDPDWPIYRINQIIEHSEIKTLLTTTDHLQLLKGSNSPLPSVKNVLLLDGTDVVLYDLAFDVFSCKNESSKHISANLRTITKESIAYIMYTSGTTGIPKGVMVDHASVEIFLSWLSEEFEISADDKFILSSSLGFGGSIRQIFSTLLAGGELHPIDRYDFKDPVTLLEFLAVRGITIFNTVPSVLQSICAYVEEHKSKNEPYTLENLRLLLIGGEVLHGKTVKHWRTHFGLGQRFVNLYGSTETIVNATIYNIPESSGYEDATPIGTPRKGSHVLLLNHEGKECKTNEKGEFYIGGPSIARGYYKSEVYSNEKFIENPIDKSSGLYYKTGDIAKRDKDGIYHYIGRIDNQIQIYGNRIEPTEIELVLTSSSLINGAAILAFKDDKRHWTVAFIELTDTEPSLDEIGIRNMIGEKFPSHMIPHNVVFLDKLPLNHAGKIDRKTLQENYDTDLGEERDFANDSTIQTIIGIWKNVFKIDEISINEDFFSLGGDSIMALEVLHHIRKSFKVSPKPVELFRKRTICELAEHLDKINSNDLIEDFKDGKSKPYAGNKFPLSITQKGFYLINSNNSSNSLNLVGTIPIEGPLDPGSFIKALDVLIGRHAILRTGFFKEGLNTVQQIFSHEEIQVENLDITSKSNQEREDFTKKIEEKLQREVFDLSHPPLYKIIWIKETDSLSKLMLCIHHIVGDAWSLKILLDELLWLYHQNSLEAPLFLPEITSSFRDVVNYENARRFMVKGEYSREEEFWKNTFSRSKNIKLESKWLKVSAKDQEIVLHISKSKKETLQKLCAEHSLSLFQLFFTIYARALSKIVGEIDLLICSSVSGRDLSLPDINKVIGPFAKSLPVGIKLTNDNIRSDYAQLNQSFLNSLENQDIPAKDLMKIYLQNGGITLKGIYQFFISFMDFSSLDGENPSEFKFDWDNARFLFDSGSTDSNLMLGIRVADGIHINLGGKTSSKFKSLIGDYIQEGVTQFIREYDTDDLGDTRTIDAALIAYFPSSRTLSELLPVAAAGKEITKKFIKTILPNDRPKLLEIENTVYGKTGVIFIPYYAEELQKVKSERLLHSIDLAIEEAKKYGAKHISLAGNLPSLTNYGFAVRNMLGNRSSLAKSIAITTGHSCTVVAVVKTVEKVLAATGLSIDNINVAVAGFGSIGQSSINLLLSKLGTPASITIADLSSQIPALQQPLDKLRNIYKGRLDVIAITKEIPDEFYFADLIIGSSSQGEILEVDKLAPGTIIVDDSFPHIVNCPKAIKRMKVDKDVLIVGGGKIDMGYTERTLLETNLPKNLINFIVKKAGDQGLPGCRVESLMMSYNDSLPATIGLVTDESAEEYWNILSDLNIVAVDFHLQGFQIKENIINNIKRHLKRNGKIG
tara:strand:- start:1804 stop:10641 length:8838 start_codon:yes stop_codon:yes gene_type:complete